MPVRRPIALIAQLKGLWDCIDLLMNGGNGGGGQGPQGPPGPKGDKGDPGDVGPAGSQGENGEQGPPGNDGAAGAQGQAGVQGPPGETGSSGPQGETGAAGQTGSQGPAGIQGPPGEQGPAGGQGQQGQEGQQGPEGPEGPPGNDGQDGAQGQQGIQGPPGTDGVRIASTVFGYSVGAGGTVAQATSKTTAVTLNTLTGQITMASGALAAGAIATFVLNNSQLLAGDHLVTSHHSGGTIGPYLINGRVTGNGAASIAVRNTSAASLNEAPVIKFSVIRAVTA